MENLDITTTDLKSVVQIIDVLSGRGAFRGDEMANVGILRNKIANFAQWVEDDQKKANDLDAAAEPGDEE